MKRTPAKRSSLFLLELIIAILFFSLTSAVCVQFFARAHQISRQTQELNAGHYPVGDRWHHSALCHAAAAWHHGRTLGGGCDDTCT